MQLIGLLMVIAHAPTVGGTGVSLEAIGLVRASGRNAVIEYSTTTRNDVSAKLPTSISQIVVREALPANDPESRTSAPRVLWSDEPRVNAHGPQVMGRISFLALEQKGWVAAAVASPWVAMGQIDLWSGSETIFPADAAENVRDSRPPHVEVAHVRYVELANVHLDEAPSAHLASELDSPALCSWGGSVWLFGTCASIGYDPKHDWGQASRGIWCAKLHANDPISKSIHDETLPARWIGPGVHPAVLAARDRLVLASWDGGVENIGLPPRPVRFQCSSDLVDWHPDPSLPDSLPVSERFEIVGALPSLLIVSEDPHDKKKLRAQRLVSGAWTELPPITIHAGEVRLEFPLLMGPVTDESACAVWVEADGRWKAELVPY